MPSDQINSKKYWDYRFDTDWEKNSGRGQTEYFGHLALSLIPDWISEDITNNKLSIGDVGCAEGDATQLISLKFPQSEITGIDFSENAIKNAGTYFPDLNFFVSDILELKMMFDVIFSSNTLEHFNDPIQVMNKLTYNCSNYLIFLLPFQEYSRIEEHFFTFDHSSFPLQLNNGFSLIYHQEYNCDNKDYWPGKQIMVIYSKMGVLSSENINLGSLNDSLYQKINFSEDKIGTLNEKLTRLDKLIEESGLTIDNQSSEINNLRYLLEESENESRRLSRRTIKNEVILNDVYNSGFWRIAKIYYNLRDRKPFWYFYKSAKTIKNEGLYSFWKKSVNRVFYKNKSLHMFEHQYELKKILRKHKNKHIVIFPDLVDWDIPLFQRPQHIALRLAKHNFLYFYCTPNSYDNLHGFKQIEESCYLTNRLDLLKQIEKQKVIHIYSTDMNPINSFINESLDKGDIILYEYIDEIHEDLSGSIPEHVREKHTQILNDERCIVVASATKLYDEVKLSRSKNFELITNGVDYNHFHLSSTEENAPKEIENLLKLKQPIIGYYGALASWFDYDLVIELAKSRPDYQILLIGWKYDGSIEHSGIEEYSNITVIGPFDYKILPQFAYWFDVSIIPFKINDITESTSPVKLFEYMALGKPIVTTDLPECRKYESVQIGATRNEFMTLIDSSLTLRNDAEYANTLNREALENTWDSKASLIAELIRKNLS